MVRAVLQAKNSNLPYLDVHATRGKEIRAEPISAIYDLGKVHHIGYFPELEDEMQAMLTSGYTGLRSPNRLDALVWALTELFPKMTRKDDKPMIVPKINVAPRTSRSHAQYGGKNAVKVNTRSKRVRRM
jgi:phage terminase large subunit-like protein